MTRIGFIREIRSRWSFSSFVGALWAWWIASIIMNKMTRWRY